MIKECFIKETSEGKGMSKEQAIHELYLICKDINFDDTFDMIKNAESKEERDFVRVVTDFILQQKQEKAIAEIEILNQKIEEQILFAGVNGAGKTTLYQTKPHIHNMAQVNLDEIVRKNGDWKNQGDIMEATREAVSMIKNYFETGISFNQETTLCGKHYSKYL